MGQTVLVICGWFRVTWADGVLGLAAGLVIAAVTALATVPGAVFLLPVQLSVLRVPGPGR